MRLEDLTGRKFNNLLVVNREIVEGSKKTYWMCACDCGKQTRVCADSLKNSRIKSCGCMKGIAISRQRTSHGGSGTPTYKSWNAMMRRCYNPKDTAYHYYGGSGIVVVDKWHDYPAFLRDMGERQKGLTIDRINGEDDYRPGNCRWATMAEQNRNKPTLQRHSAFGREMYFWEWAALVDIPPAALRLRIIHGMSLEDALLMAPKSVLRRLLPISSFPALMLALTA
jgi:hypothetical protein